MPRYLIQSQLKLTSRQLLMDGVLILEKKSQLKGYETYALICEETPEIIEGCLIFEMQEVVGAYMAFIEVAPHNRFENKKYHKVAGSLIAFACRMSFSEEMKNPKDI